MFRLELKQSNISQLKLALVQTGVSQKLSLLRKRFKSKKKKIPTGALIHLSDRLKTNEYNDLEKKDLQYRSLHNEMLQFVLLSFYLIIFRCILSTGTSVPGSTDISTRRGTEDRSIQTIVTTEQERQSNRMISLFKKKKFFYHNTHGTSLPGWAVGQKTMWLVKWTALTITWIYKNNTTVKPYSVISRRSCILCLRNCKDIANWTKNQWL